MSLTLINGKDIKDEEDINGEEDGARRKEQRERGVEEEGAAKKGRQRGRSDEEVGATRRKE